MADETREWLMNIQWHRQLLLSGVSKYAIAAAQAFPDATRVRVRRAWSWHPQRPFGYAGVVFGWALALSAGAIAAMSMMWALGYG